MTTDEGRKPEGAPARSPIAGGDVGALGVERYSAEPQDGGGSASIAGEALDLIAPKPMSPLPS